MSVQIELHDASIDDPCGTLCASFRVEDDLQIDRWLNEDLVKAPEVVKVKAEDGRVWLREGDKFVLQERVPEPDDDGDYLDRKYTGKVRA